MDGLEYRTPQERFLLRVLRGEQVGVDAIDELLSQRVVENIHLDYKSGLFMEDERGRAEAGHPRKFESRLRKFITGFANADGGVLIIGVAEPKRRNEHGCEERDPARPCFVDGIPRAVARDAERAHTLAGQALRKLPVGVASSVRLLPIDHPAGLILIVATPRYDGLVSVVEQEQVVHYFRMADNTVAAPDYLARDLLLGRRRRTEFEVELAGDPVVDKDPNEVAHVLFTLRIKNTGLVWMERTRVGVVGYSEYPGGEPISDSMAVAIEVREMGESRTAPRVHSLTVGPPTLAEAAGPYEVLSASPNRIAFRVNISGQIFWTAAVFVLHYNQPARWFQLLIHVERGSAPRGWVLPAIRRRPVVMLSYGSVFSPWVPSITWFRTPRDESGREVVEILDHAEEALEIERRRPPR